MQDVRVLNYFLSSLTVTLNALLGGKYSLPPSRRAPGMFSWRFLSFTQDQCFISRKRDTSIRPYSRIWQWHSIILTETRLVRPGPGMNCRLSSICCLCYKDSQRGSDVEIKHLFDSSAWQRPKLRPKTQLANCHLCL